MAQLVLTASDLPRIDHVLAQLEEHAADTSPLMDRIGQVVESSTLRRFDEERAPDGAKWLPSQRARTEGGKTLTKSAALRQSITRNVLSPDAVEVGTNKIYGGIHQHGGTIRAKGGGRLTFRLPGLGFRSVESVVIPARPYLGVSADDEAEILSQAEDYLAEVLPA